MTLQLLFVVALAAFIQGYSGFGFGLISMSIFALMAVDLEKMSAIVTIDAVAVLLLLLVLSKESGTIHWRKVALVCVGAAIGLPIGYALLATFKDHHVFRVAVGAAILGFGVHGLLAPSALRNLGRAWGLLLGAAGGLISGALVSGGPPIVLYFYSQGEDARDMKASLQAAFLISILLRCALVGVHSERYGWETLHLAALTIPVACVLLVLGHYAAKRVCAMAFRRVVFGMLCLSGAVTIAWTLAAN